MAEKTSKKNGTLEFLRFIFCLCVLLFHAQKYILGEASLKNGVHLAFFPHGAIGVEFFFLLTGLFLAQSVYKEYEKNPVSPDLGDDTLKFIKKKFASIFSYHIVAFVFIYLATIIIAKYSLSESLLTLVDSLPSIFFLQMTGIPGIALNHVEWYLSAMFIALIILYPICRKHFKFFIKYLAPVVSIILLGFIGYNAHRLTGVNVWMYITYRGVLRGIAEILLGAFAFYLSQELSSKYTNASKITKVLLTIMEWVLYLAIIIFIVMTFKNKYEFTALFTLFLGVVITYSKVTYSSKIFDNKVAYFLGKLSLPIYLSQVTAIYLVGHVFASFSNTIQIILVVVITLVLAILDLLLGDFLKKRKQIA